ncbi:MAG: anti-sigma factor family protein [Candidatus Polarisedimenticolia bacterium]
MMDCGGLRPILSFYLEKETGPLETLEARRHLDACPACRARASRMAGTMARCDALEAQSPASDITAMVMGKLADLKRAARRVEPALAAKWSGVALLLAAGLSAISSPVTPVIRLLSRPAAFLAGLAAGGSGDRLRDALGGALPLLPASLSDGVRSDIASAGVDAALAVQLLGTALVFGLGLAVPVALVTAWLLHREASGRS